MPIKLIVNEQRARYTYLYASYLDNDVFCIEFNLLNTAIISIFEFRQWIISLTDNYLQTSDRFKGIYISTMSSYYNIILK